MLLEAVIIYQLYWLNIVLRLMTVFYDMHMDWQMIVAVEHKSESKENEYCWHNVIFAQ